MSANEMKLDVGIVVRDVDKCLAFYRDVIGLPVVREARNGNAGLWSLQCGESQVRLVALDPAPELANPPGEVFGATGLRFLGIDVDDIEACVGRCEAAGAAVTMPVRDGRTPGIRIAMVEDPEGNTVEFIDRSGVA